MWGLASHSDVLGPGAGLDERRRARGGAAGLFVPVVSLPSENVPAPPTPNWMLLSGSRTPVALMRADDLGCGECASSPRSTSSGSQARAGKRQRAEKARAPRPDHDDAAVGHALYRLGEQEGLLVHEPHALLGASPGELAQKGAPRILACAQPNARGEGQHNVVLLACVDGAAPALDPRELTFGHTELLCDGATQRGELAGVGAVELG